MIALAVVKRNVADDARAAGGGVRGAPIDP